MHIEIKKCTIDDLFTLQDIGYETFKETFEDQNTAENMSSYLDRAFTEEKLTAELLNPSSQFFFVLVDGDVAGYLKINMNDAQSEEMNHDMLEIERIYIRSSFQNQGLGNVLLQKAIDIGCTNHKTSIWLGVWEKNEQAISFYKRKGFVQTDEHSFYMGDEKQIDWIMEKKLGR